MFHLSVSLTVVFHRSDVLPNLHDNNTLYGINNHKFCSFKDDSIIHFNNITNKYDIENILCSDYNPIVSFGVVFTNHIDPTELDILRDIITYPWDYRINRYAGVIREAPLAPPSSPVGGNFLCSYKGKKYKIHTGEKNGKYIIVNKKKIYIKNHLKDNSINVIAIKDPINKSKWWYTISWISKNGQFNKINKSSEELGDLSLKQYVKNLILYKKKL
jgi:hypothetical protein